MQIGLHELLDEIDLLEAEEIGWSEDVEDGDDVLVVEVSEELDLAEGAETEHGVVKGGDALDCDAALGGEMSCGADDAVCAFADDIEDVVAVADDEGSESIVHGKGDDSRRAERGNKTSTLFCCHYDARLCQPQPRA